MWVLLDNYDSFTYLLQDYLLQIGNEACTVLRNDEVTLSELIKLNPTRLIISPGPETPIKAGITLESIAYFHDKVPILGVCLGHQAIGQFFGADLEKSPQPKHGITSDISFIKHPLFEGISQPFTAMRYHSLVLKNCPSELKILATSTDDGCIQSIIHQQFPSIGLQFHPESIGTKEGLKILSNWNKIYH